MKKQSLDMWEDFPIEAKRYFKNFGYHFNAKACKLAVDSMKRKNPATQKLEKIDPWSKDEIDDLLKKHSIVLENNVLHDYVYVANMAKADFFKSCLATDREVALYIKDVIDDPDAVDGQVFNRWFSDRMFKGEPIEWSEIL